MINNRPAVKLSIVVPIYNAKPYIKRCIDSILKQTYTDFELILVDDGSTDGSENICDAYEQADDRVHVIHKKNGGLVSARNVGIKFATGTYISFVDSDDWIDEKFCEEILSRMTAEPSVDICIAGVKQNFPDGYERLYYKVGSEQSYGGEKAFIEMFERNIFSWELWGKIFRLNLMNDIVEDESVVQLEDLERSLHVVPFAGRVIYTPSVYYHYYYRTSSMIHDIYNLNDTTFVVYERVLASRFGKESIIREHLMRWIYSIFRVKIRECVYVSSRQYMKCIKQHRKIFETLFDCNEILQLKNIEGEYFSHDYYRMWIKAFSKMEKIVSDVATMDNIYIYGTGVYAKYFAKILKDRKVVWRAFVVSDDAGYHDYEFMGKKVYRLSELKMDIKDSVLVVMVSKVNSISIRKNLTKQGIEKYIDLNDETIC